MRIAVRFIVAFCIALAVIMFGLTLLAWPQSTYLMKVSMLAGSLTFVGAAAIFLGRDYNRKDLMRCGWVGFIGFATVFIATLIAVTAHA